MAATTQHRADPFVSDGQLARLSRLLDEIVPANRFQTARLRGRRRLDTAAAFADLPLLTKRDLVADVEANGPFGTNLTYPLERYTRYFQTSGTTGSPLPVLDTPESWAWWARGWREVYAAGGVTASDRLYFAFSFGPFIGFWAAHEGATAIGALCIPGGGATSSQRLRTLLATEATVLLCTPSYAMHLAETAARDGLDLRGSALRLVIVSGEPGGSIPATRARIEEAFGAAVLDHAGASEVGPWGIGCPGGLRVNEGEFIAEVLDPATSAPVAPGSGQTGELVLTNLGRTGWPIIRYRTGDLVRPARLDLPSPHGLFAGALVFEGGLLGRVDDMIIVRGVNVFPSAVEDVVRGIAGMAEFRITATRRGAMDELAIEAEVDEATCERIGLELRARIGIRVDAQPVAVGSLPRWEAGKARRFVKAQATGL